MKMLDPKNKYAHCMLITKRIKQYEITAVALYMGSGKK